MPSPPTTTSGADESRTHRCLVKCVPADTRVLFCGGEATTTGRLRSWAWGRGLKSHIRMRFAGVAHQLGGVSLRTRGSRHSGGLCLGRELNWPQSSCSGSSLQPPIRSPGPQGPLGRGTQQASGAGTQPCSDLGRDVLAPLAVRR